MSIDQARKIDLEKTTIQVRYIPEIRAIFNHMAVDAKNLYLATKRVPAESLALNYRPEFLKVCRDSQRTTIKKFGFNIRKDAEKKGFNFKTQKHESLIEYQIETKDVEAVLPEDGLDKVNNEFALDASLFVANSSEEQADYITETNEKELANVEKMAVILFFTEQSNLNTKLNKLRDQRARIEFEQMLGGSNNIAAAKKKILQAKIDATEKELAELIANKEKFIADTIEQKIIEKGVSRSELIASQNVGMAEAWARQKEAELIEANVSEIEIKKKWQAILDSHTRSSHVAADLNPLNQAVNVDGFFTVGSYKAKMPRSENLPPEESINCRCVAIYVNQ